MIAIGVAIVTFLLCGAAIIFDSDFDVYDHSKDPPEPDVKVPKAKVLKQ